MAVSTLAKHYNLLDGAERFSAVIEAMARGDGDEQHRLDESCPRALYEIDDPTYRMRIDIAFTATALVCASIQRDLDVLRTIAAVHDVLGVFQRLVAENAEEAYFAGWYARGKLAKNEVASLTDDEMAIHGQSVLLPLDIARRCTNRSLGTPRAISLLSAWDGLSRFCHDCCGVEPLLLVRALRLLDEDPAAEARQLYPEAKVDAELADHWYQTVVSAWRNHIDRLEG